MRRKFRRWDIDMLEELDDLILADLADKLSELDEEMPTEAELEERRLEKLNTFAASLRQRRRTAIDGRKNSGIEAIWDRAIANYNGHSELNKLQYHKGLTPDSRLTEVDAKMNGLSTAIINITQPYVDMGAARTSDMLLPTDDEPFNYTPTPLPESGDLKDSPDPVEPGSEMTVGQLTAEYLADMAKKADAAKTQVWDWVVEAKWHSKMRRALTQNAKLGAGCMKGPFPIKKNNRSVKRGEDGTLVLTIEDKIQPSSTNVDIRNLFPDPACGDDIHNGSYIFERELVTAKQIHDLMDMDYMDDQLKEVLKEGPSLRYLESNDPTQQIENDVYELWYYYGIATAEDLASAKFSGDCGHSEQIPVVVTMINDRVVKATMSVLDSGEFPYDVINWQKRDGHWAGIGVAEQIFEVQDSINASFRMLMDNSARAGGPQLIINTGLVTPADGDWSMTPWKIWYAASDMEQFNVDDVFKIVSLPIMQPELENIIRLALDFAERLTSMPLIMQGGQGANTTTAHGMDILQSNANSVLKRIARIADDDLFEPHFGRYYEWLMTYSTDESLKGDYQIVTNGSTAFFERASQNMLIIQLLPLANDPTFGLDKRKLMKEAIKMSKMNADRVSLSDDDFKKMQEAQAQNPPKAPAVQAAEIRVQGDMEKAKMINDADMKELEQKGQLDEASLNMKLHMLQLEQAHQERMKTLDMNMRIMELAQAQQISIDSIKAALATDSAKLQTQKELSLLGAHERMTSTPPTEPVGKAPPGEAYQR
jgi:hypothetical protein